MNTEGGRISQLVDSARRCAIQEQLAKAQNFYGIDSCGTCKPINRTVKDVQTEGAYLNSQVANCKFNYYKPPVVPESVRIARIQLDIIEKETDPLNPNTRFVQYAPTPTVVVCPQVNLLNGPPNNTICQLPNTITNPILPR